MPQVHSTQMRTLRPKVGMSSRSYPRHSSQAGRPDKRNLPTWATPFRGPVVAIIPLDTCANARVGRCAMRAARLCASVGACVSASATANCAVGGA